MRTLRLLRPDAWHSMPPSHGDAQFGKLHPWLTSRGSLTSRLVANVGVDQMAAEKAVAIVLDFLRKEGPADKVQALIERLPGAEALMQSQQIDSGGMGGLMGAGSKMMAAGLSMGQVQGVTREIIAYTRDKAGDEAIGEIVGAIPGLGQFI